MASFDEIKPFIEAQVEKCGAELFDARFFGMGSRSVLRVTIDKQGGVTVADCEAVSGAIGALLDEKEFNGGKPYTLEVSSPGIDRVLKTERDFARIAGKNVTLNLAMHVPGKKTLRGTVISCEGGTLNIDTGKETLNVQLSDILSGKEEISF